MVQCLSHLAGMQGPGAAKGDKRELAWVEARSTEIVRMARSIVALATRTTPGRPLSCHRASSARVRRERSGCR